MPNILKFHKRLFVIRSLLEGASIRATSRACDVDKDVVMRLGVTVGEGCMKLHDELVRDVRPRLIEVDETDGVLVAVDADTELVLGYATGKRTLPLATKLMKELHARVRGKPQIAVDTWPGWIESVRRTFGWEVAERTSATSRTPRPVPWAGHVVGSRKREHQAATVGLHVFHRNFVELHEALGTALAVRAGLAKEPWTLEELVTAALEAAGETAEVRAA